MSSAIDHHESFRVESAAGIATVTLDPPERMSAIGWSTWVDLREVFDSLGMDGSVRVVVLTGAGTVFCTGADIKDPAYRAIDPEPGPISAQMRRRNATATALYGLPKPTIAAVNGVARRRVEPGALLRHHDGCIVGTVRDVVRRSRPHDGSRRHVAAGSASRNPACQALAFTGSFIDAPRMSEGCAIAPLRSWHKPRQPSTKRW